MSNKAYILDGLRTPIGRYGGGLANVRADDLAAIPLKALLTRYPALTSIEVEDVLLGCANQAGEDNRNVARMSLLLAGLPLRVPGQTINRLCASGLSAVAQAASRIVAGEAHCYLAGGVEQMSRAPWVMAKPEQAFSRTPQIFDTTMGWRFINPELAATFGTDSMGETAENVASEYVVSRADQDAFAFHSQQKTTAAVARNRFDVEIIPVTTGKATVSADEFPRPDTTIEALASLKPAFRREGSVTAGNASGINDGSCALLLGTIESAESLGIAPLARVIGSLAIGVEPRLMGIGPVPATQKLLSRLGLSLDQIDVIELNEAFAAQSIACLRALGLSDTDPRVNPNGGAIALGHPLGMTGARLALTAARELQLRQARYALVTMCVGVGQGMAMVLERESV